MKNKFHELKGCDEFAFLFPKMVMCKKKDVYYTCQKRGIDKFGQPDVWLFRGNKEEMEIWMKGAISAAKGELNVQD